MSPARRGSYQITLLALIVVVLFLVLFGVLAYTSYQEAETLYRGDPEQTYGSTTSVQQLPLVALQQRADSIEADVERAHATYQEARRQRYLADLELGEHGIYFEPGSTTPKYGGLEENGAAWVRTRESVQAVRTILETHRDEIRGADDIHEPLTEATNHFRDIQARISRQVADRSFRFRDEMESLGQKLDQLEEQIAETRAEFNSRRSSLASEKVQLENEIRELLDLHLQWLDELQPVGQVAEVTIDQNTLIINIGAADRVFNGLHLEIFDYDQGRYQRKGMCEVIETNEHYAVCRITAQRNLRSDPIVRGDLIGNPIFNTERAPVVVLAGEFQSFNRADIAAFLRRAGTTVATQLGPNVDFLIAGEFSEEEQNLAREYRITAMHEDQVLRFLDTSFDFRNQAD